MLSWYVKLGIEHEKSISITPSRLLAALLPNCRYARVLYYVAIVHIMTLFRTE